MRPFRRVFSFGRQYGRSIQLETPQKAFAPRSARDGYSWRRTWPFIVGAVAAVSSVSAVFADNREGEHSDKLQLSQLLFSDRQFRRATKSTVTISSEVLA